MLLLYVYLGSLVVGGILLGASLLLGHDNDADADVDLDGDVHVELDADAAADVDGGADHGDLDAGHGGALADVWLPFVSLRFWVFFLAFFGATGTVLSLFALAGRWPTFITSLLMGLIIGFAAAFIIQRLKKDVVGEVVDVEHYRGLEGTVLLPIPANLTGKVRLTVQGQTVDLPARTDEDTAIGVGTRVLVIDCVEGRLQVVPASDLAGDDEGARSGQGADGTEGAEGGNGADR